MKYSNKNGFTLIELLVSVAISAILITGMSTVIDHALHANEMTQLRNNCVQNAHFAMQRMVNAVATTRQLMLPQNDKSNTNYREHVREQTVPASSPEGSSSRATAVLAVVLPSHFDLDGNNIPDADNDRDGRIDEDFPRDSTNDNVSGIIGIDDGGNGLVDECVLWGRDDDDEQNFCGAGEDPIDGVDDDGDNTVDDDADADMNNDGEPGIAGVDDDNDGDIDEGDKDDDDEDGSIDEDWLDPLVYYLNDGNLIERIAVPWDENGSGSIDGRDFIESILVENVTRLRIERVPMTSGQQTQLVAITLELTPPGGEEFSLTTQVRVAAGL